MPSFKETGICLANLCEGRAFFAFIRRILNQYKSFERWQRPYSPYTRLNNDGNDGLSNEDTHLST